MGITAITWEQIVRVVLIVTILIGLLLLLLLIPKDSITMLCVNGVGKNLDRSMV